MSTELTPALKDFISRHIASVEQLEVLLLLYEGRGRDWSAAEIDQRLRSQPASIEKWLEIIVSQGLAQRTGDRVKFFPASPELGDNAALVARAYRERPIKIIELIFAKPDKGLLDFVRAFNLRKNP